MAKGLLGRKIGMTQVFQADGEICPVTVIKGGPCTVVQLKSVEKDGYNAIQLGFEDQKPQRVTKPLQGHFKKVSTTPKKFLREIRMGLEEWAQYSVGQVLKVDIFKEGELVDVTGLSKGKGFQGGIKRWHWKGGPKTHGSMSHRTPGSIGASADPSRVVKGKHLPGRMGNRRVTTQNLEVLGVDVENDLLIVKGTIPGHANSVALIKRAKKKWGPEADLIPAPSEEPEKDSVSEETSETPSPSVPSEEATVVKEEEKKDSTDEPDQKDASDEKANQSDT